MNHHIPRHENHPQLFLYKQGLKALGPEAARHHYADEDVRREGAKRVGRHVAAAALTAAGMSALTVDAIHGINNSPTVVYQDHLQEQHNAKQAEAQPPAPTDTTLPQTANQNK